MKLVQRLGIAAAAATCHLLVQHTASAQLKPIVRTVPQMHGEHWTPPAGSGAWPPAAYQWLSGDFFGHANGPKTQTKDLAMVWSYDDGINIDVHNSEIDLGGALAGPRQFGLFRGANNDGGWPTTAQWMAGDFNHDGVSDIADAFRNNNGNISIDVHVNNGGGYFARENAESDLAGWVSPGTFVAGDFNHDGWDDIALVWEYANQIVIDVHVNNRVSAGNPQFHVEHWVSEQGGWVPGATIFAGNFDSVEGADIAYVYAAYTGNPDALMVDVHSSLGSAQAGGFSLKHFEQTPSTSFNSAAFINIVSTNVAGNVYGTVLADVNGVTKSVDYDSIVFATSDGTTWAAPGEIDVSSWMSTGSGFAPYNGSTNPTPLATGQWDWPVTASWVGGDFDGDGFGDVADVFENNGVIDIDVHIH